eukprot:501043_1
MSLSDSKYDAESESANDGNIDMCSWSFLDNMLDNMEIVEGSTSDGYTWSTFDFGSHHRNNFVTSSESETEEDIKEEKETVSYCEEETEEEKETVSYCEEETEEEKETVS